MKFDAAITISAFVKVLSPYVTVRVRDTVNRIVDSDCKELVDHSGRLAIGDVSHDGCVTKSYIVFGGGL